MSEEEKIPEYATDLPFDKRMDLIARKECVPFTYADMSFFGILFIKKKVLINAYLADNPSEREQDAEKLYAKSNEYYFKILYNTMSEGRFTNFADKARIDFSTMALDAFEDMNERMQRECNDAYIIDRTTYNEMDYLMMKTDIHMFMNVFSTRIFSIVDNYCVLMTPWNCVTVLFTRHRHNQRAYQFLAVIWQMNPISRYYDYMRMLLLPPGKEQSDFFVHKSVFLTALPEELISFMSSNKIKNELYYITEDPNYQPKISRDDLLPYTDNIKYAVFARLVTLPAFPRFEYMHNEHFNLLNHDSLKHAQDELLAIISANDEKLLPQFYAYFEEVIVQVVSKVLYHANARSYMGSETVFVYLRHLKLYDVFIKTIGKLHDNYSLIMPIFFACYDMCVYILPVYFMKAYRPPMISERFRPVDEIAECEEFVLALDCTFADAYRYLQNMPRFVYCALKHRSFFRSRMLKQLAKFLFDADYYERANELHEAIQPRAYAHDGGGVQYIDDGYDYGLADLRCVNEHGANTFSFVHLIGMLFLRVHNAKIGDVEEILSYALGERVILTFDEDGEDVQQLMSASIWANICEFFNEKGMKMPYFTLYKIFGKYIFENYPRSAANPYAESQIKAFGDHYSGGSGKSP